MVYKNRQSTRLKIFDYNSTGAYFITICTQNKEHLFSKVKLTIVGTSVPTELVCVEKEVSNAPQHSLISRFISTFKRFCNKEIGKNIWQKSFFDHIIRDKKDYDFHIKYIRENPIKWYFHGENHDDVMHYE